MKQQMTTRTPQYWLVLLAIAFVSIFYYGLRAAAVLGLAAVTAVLTDFVCLFLRNKPYKAADLSNIGTALLLAMMLPASVPYSIVILSTVFAVAVGSHVFGSRGTSVFPPAAVGYLFAVINWKDEVLRFPAAGEHLGLFGNENIALESSLSAAVNTGHALNTETLDLLLGAVSGPMGTGCLLLLLLDAVVLLFSRDLSFAASLGYLGGISVGAMYMGVTPVQLLSVNMLLFAMLFLACDIHLLPESPVSRMLNGMLIGLTASCLIVYYQLEYAVVIAVILCSPVLHGLTALDEKEAAERFTLQRKPEIPEVQRAVSEPKEEPAAEAESDVPEEPDTAPLAEMEAVS